MRLKTVVGISAALFLSVGTFEAQTSSTKSAGHDDSEARPPVTSADLRIVQRARGLLDSPAAWNRADNRICPATANTYSLYCALERATEEVSGHLQHRGAAMQEARIVIEDVAPNWKQYHHRLMDYNNDPRTTFADIHRVLRLLEERIKRRLAEESGSQKE